MDNRVGFIRWLLGDDDAEGYVSVATLHSRSGEWAESIFDIEEGLDELAEFVNTKSITGNVYFCPTLLATRKRVKANIRRSWCLWADLDECPPESLRVKPTVLVETSPGRHQAYWRFKDPIHADIAEALNRNIAYAHKDEGCDTSGWDLTQQLRVPGTKNYKRLPQLADVKVIDASTDLLYEVEDFSVYPEVEGSGEIEEFPFPEVLPDLSGQEVLEKYKTSINSRVWQLFENTPSGDWSNSLWQLCLMLFDLNCSREEVFIVAKDSACNKFGRDHRYAQDQLLWRDVLRAYTYSNNQRVSLAANSTDEDDVWRVSDKDLLTDLERAQVEHLRTFVDDYCEWAEGVGDAAPQYHVAGAFIALSSILGSSLRLATSFGEVKANIWFMILADTTLTRKTTAMDLAVDLVVDVDPGAIMATDGSIEGLMGTIATRPGQAALFLRDEFSGLLEAMSKKDYYAGMLEMFTKLYDGKFQKRVLKKEVIEVRDPVLIMFTGGIKERIYELLDFNHINSGFLPRFCFITAESDLARVRPLGPPSVKALDGRDELRDRLAVMYSTFNPPPDPTTIEIAKFGVEMTPEAWLLYNRFENIMLEIGTESSAPDLMTPMMARLTTSGLKAAMLLAASQLDYDGRTVTITEDILLKAFSYVEDWKAHSIAIVANAGTSANEREMSRIYNRVKSTPGGVPRAELMRLFRLNSREASAVFDTLEQRGLIRIQATEGRGAVVTTTNSVG